MTKIERKYIFRKKVEKLLSRYKPSTMSQKLFDSIDKVGAAATHLYIDNEGMVHVEALTPDQCLDLMSWDNIPEENFCICNLPQLSQIDL